MNYSHIIPEVGNNMGIFPHVPEVGNKIGMYLNVINNKVVNSIIWQCISMFVPVCLSTNLTEEPCYYNHHE